MHENSLDIALKIIAILTPLGGVAGLGWWLRDQFSKRDAKLFTQLDSVDQKRERQHNENQLEFRKIYMGLTQLGWRNGGK